MKKRIFAMDFVRTIATIIIIIFHFNFSIDIRNLSSFTILKNTFVNIDLKDVGVPMFFVLSGFALMYSYEDDFSIGRFYSKRLKAMYPMYWIAYFLVTVYYFLTYQTLCPFGEHPMKSSFIFTVIGLDGYLTPIMTNWYRVGEWFFGCIILMYIVFPFLRWGIRRFSKIFWIPWVCMYDISL